MPMGVNWSCCLVAALAISATVAGSQAQTALLPSPTLPGWAQCKGASGASPDAQLSACTAVIESPDGSKYAAPYEVRCKLLFDKSQLDDAIKDCSRAIEINPNDIDAYHTRAVAYFSKKDNDKAIADCNNLLKLMPAGAGTLTLRGLAYSQKGDYDDAIADFGRALELRPGFGMAQSGLDQARRAKANLASGQKLGDQRAWCDGKALPQEGFAQDLQIKGCSTLIQSGKEMPDDLARDYFNRGSAYDFAGTPDKAIPDFDRAIKLKPDFADAYYRRGVIYQIKSDNDHAIADLTNAIKYDPTRVLSFTYRGYAYASKGQFDLAIADFDRVIALQPDNADAFLNRCRARNGKGDYDGAVADCDQAIKLSKTSEATEAYDSRGDAHFLKGDFSTAIADYNQALDLWPQYPEAMYGRGAAKARRGDAAGGKVDMDIARDRKTGVDAAEARIGIRP
jgi:tetratricopeptide (TPR) repeat protein